MDSSFFKIWNVFVLYYPGAFTRWMILLNEPMHSSFSTWHSMSTFSFIVAAKATILNDQIIISCVSIFCIIHHFSCIFWLLFLGLLIQIHLNQEAFNDFNFNLFLLNLIIYINQWENNIQCNDIFTFITDSMWFLQSSLKQSSKSFSPNFLDQSWSLIKNTSQSIATFELKNVVRNVNVPEKYHHWIIFNHQDHLSYNYHFIPLQTIPYFYLK